MAYNSLIDRANDAAALIPEDVSREIIRGVQNKSAVLEMFRHRTMSRAQQRMPVLNILPTAYFVNGDTGLKATTEMSWTNKYLDAEEIAVIVPIPEKLLDDVDYNLWDEIKPDIEEAVGVALDNAVFFGTNKPSSWPSDIKTAAAAAGNSVTAGTSAVDVAEDINQGMAAVEADGYDVNGFWARRQFRATLRGLRDSQKQPIFQSTLGGIEKLQVDSLLYNEKIVFNSAGLSGFATGTGNVHLIGGDWSQGIVGIRQDITYKMLDQAALFDDSGTLIYNLPQQDMIALRCVARFAWQTPNPVNRMNTNSSTRYPWFTLLQA